LRTEWYDVVVVGLGVMGSATAAKLAEAGLSVLAVEAAPSNRPQGASTDDSRLYRRIYPEDSEYAAWTEAALQEWRRLQVLTGRRLFLRTGSLTVAQETSSAWEQLTRAATGLPHRRMSTQSLRAAYPKIRFDADALGIIDPHAGLLLADDCVRAFRQRAVQAGAQLRFNVAMDLSNLISTWTSGHQVNVGRRLVRADAAVVAIGAWLVGSPVATGWLDISLERTVSHWFRAAPGLDVPAITWHQPGKRDLCLFPPVHGNIKVKYHHTTGSRPATPIPQIPKIKECREIRNRLHSTAGISLDQLTARAATYTNTVDSKFIVREHPRAPSMIIISACSGHGFKFAPVIAGLVGALLDVAPSHDRRPIP
jgi:sarcosine oxidase